MRKGKWWLAVAVGALAVALGASMAMATDLDPGEYRLELPGVGELFIFDVNGGVEEAVVSVMVDDYEIDDHDPDKASWKDETGLPVLEVEAKTDKVEGDWNGEYAILSLPGGGTITVYKPGAETGDPVVTTGDWTVIGVGDDWYVFDGSDIAAATKFFHVEFNDDAFEFRAVDEIPENLFSDIAEDEEEEFEAEEEEEEEEKDDD